MRCQWVYLVSSGFWAALLLIVTQPQQVALVVAQRTGKTLIFSVDNRAFTKDLESPELEYYTASAVINRAYANRHGYDFLLFRMDSARLQSSVFAKYGITNSSALADMQKHMKMDWASKTKLDVVAFNHMLKQYRSTPWTKIALLWCISTIVKYQLQGLYYDHVFYVDSDFVFNPSFHQQSLDEALKRWSINFPQVAEAPFVFFSNAPYSERPCTGGMFMNISHPSTQRLLLDWWNFDIVEHNFAHEFEQVALWRLLEKKVNDMNKNMVYLHGEQQFPPCDKLWICHLGHPWQHIRMDTLRTMLKSTLHFSPERFAKAVTSVEHSHTVVVDTFAISDAVNDKGEVGKEHEEALKNLSKEIKQRTESAHTQKSGHIDGNNHHHIRSSSSSSTSSKHQALLLYQAAYRHQFPSSCEGKKAMVLMSMQDTGLGAVIHQQVSALVKMAIQRDLVLVMNATFPESGYFQGCSVQSELKGKWHCLFQPITNCSLSALTGGVGLVIENSKDADDPRKHNIQTSDEEKFQYSVLISRPSDYAKATAMELFQRRLNASWDLVKEPSVGVHIRQGRTDSKSGDWVRQGRRVWTPEHLAEALLKIQSATNISNFIVISDDRALPGATSAALEGKHAHVKLVFTNDVVQHAVRSDLDCLRDQLGCDPNLGVANAAYAVMVDMALIASTRVFAGSQKSLFSRLLSAMVTHNVDHVLMDGIDEFDLDTWKHGTSH